MAARPVRLVDMTAFETCLGNARGISTVPDWEILELVNSHHAFCSRLGISAKQEEISTDWDFLI